MLTSTLEQGNSTEFTPALSNITCHWYFVTISIINENMKLDLTGLALEKFYYQPPPLKYFLSWRTHLFWWHSYYLTSLHLSCLNEYFSYCLYQVFLAYLDSDLSTTTSWKIVTFSNQDTTSFFCSLFLEKDL